MIAITHVPSPHMERAIRTFAEAAPVDLAVANHQHEAYRAMLERAGARVLLLDVNREHPDSCFVEDTAVVLAEVAVLTPMGTPARAGEPAGIEPALRRFREVVRVEAPATLEGGDVLRIGKTIFVGATGRTNAAGIDALSGAVARFGYSVRAVPVRGCLHLKTACTALPDGTILVNPAWIDVGELAGFSAVAIDPSEPHGANVALVGDRVCMAAAYPRTRELVEARGFTVDAVDLSEFAKVDGAVTCLSILI
jgi:dimethylargininase